MRFTPRDGLPEAAFLQKSWASSVNLARPVVCPKR
jgi:hypothetical protein